MVTEATAVMAETTDTNMKTTTEATVAMVATAAMEAMEAMVVVADMGHVWKPVMSAAMVAMAETDSIKA